MTAIVNADAAVVLRAAGGDVLDLPAHRWFAPADDAEQHALDRVVGPALDIGCGPGRHLVALAARGVFGLGIDVSPPMLHAARRQGVNVLERSVFDRVPGARRWGSALLLDGNIGIGGDPVALLTRVQALLRPHGRVIVETDPAGRRHEPVLLVRAESAFATGPWFRWTKVGHDRLVAVAGTTGFGLVDFWETDGRGFAHLERDRPKR
jgi:SAM-dependent methyltransferase